MEEDAILAICNSPWNVPPLIAPPFGWGGDIIGNDILSVTIECLAYPLNWAGIDAWKSRFT